MRGHFSQIPKYKRESAATKIRKTWCSIDACVCERETMVGVGYSCSCLYFSSHSTVLRSSSTNAKNAISAGNPIWASTSSFKFKQISCKLPESETEANKGISTSTKMEDYNIAMKRMMRNPYEYHHDLG